MIYDVSYSPQYPKLGHHRAGPGSDAYNRRIAEENQAKAIQQARERNLTLADAQRVASAANPDLAAQLPGTSKQKSGDSEETEKSNTLLYVGAAVALGALVYFVYVTVSYTHLTLPTIYSV